MKDFNLSKWALNHRAFTGFLMALLMLGGIFAYSQFDFMALLGIIALAGMIMRNSVILVDQIEQDERSGQNAWSAIIEASVRRFRPIILTAATAILAMIPLSINDFFGPQAIAIMGGLLIATVLTIFFLPALYAAWFRVRYPETGAGSAPARPPAVAPSRFPSLLDGRT